MKFSRLFVAAFLAAIPLQSFGQAARTVNTVRDMLSFPIYSPLNPYFYAQGYHINGDGGGGNFVYLPGSVLATNRFTVFAVPGGRIKRLTDFLTPEMGGAVGDGVTDDTAVMREWKSFAGEYRLEGRGPRSIYRIVGPLVFDEDNWIAEGKNSALKFETDGADSSLRIGAAALDAWGPKQSTILTNWSFRNWNLLSGPMYDTNSAGKNLVYIHGADKGIFENNVLVGSTSTFWAVSIDASDIRVLNNDIDNQGNIYHDGIHVWGGSNIVISGNNVKSGDSSIVIGSDRNREIRYVVVDGNRVETTHGFGYHVFTTYIKGPSGEDPTNTLSHVVISDSTIRGATTRNSAIRVDDGGWKFYGSGFSEEHSPKRLQHVTFNNILIDSPASASDKTLLVHDISVIGSAHVAFNNVRSPNPYYGGILLVDVDDLDIINCFFGEPTYTGRPTIQWLANATVGTNSYPMRNRRVRILNSKIYNRSDVAIAGIFPLNQDYFEFSGNKVFIGGTNGPTAIQIPATVSNVLMNFNEFYSDGGTTNRAIIFGGGPGGSQNEFVGNSFSPNITGGSHAGTRPQGIWNESNGREHVLMDTLKFNRLSTGYQISAATNPTTMAAGVGIFRVEHDASSTIMSLGRPAQGIHWLFDMASGRANMTTPGGGLTVSDSSTDNTTKIFRIGTRHYSLLEEPIYAVVAEANQNDNVVNIGGSTSQGNAATRIHFYLSSDGTTTNLTGSNVVAILPPTSTNETSFLLRDGFDGPLYRVRRHLSSGLLHDGSFTGLPTGSAEQLYLNNIEKASPWKLTNSASVTWSTNASGDIYATATSTNGGTVTSVGLSMPSDVFNVANSPVTESETLTVTFDNQDARKVLAAPTNSTGAPTFRLMSGLDLLSALEAGSNITITTNSSNGKLRINGEAGGTNGVSGDCFVEEDSTIVTNYASIGGGGTMTHATVTIPGGTLATDGDEFIIRIPGSFFAYPSTNLQGIGMFVAWESGGDQDLANIADNALEVLTASSDTRSIDIELRIKRKSSNTFYSATRLIVGSTYSVGNEYQNPIDVQVVTEHVDMDTASWDDNQSFRIDLSHDPTVENDDLQTNFVIKTYGYLAYSVGNCAGGGSGGGGGGGGTNSIVSVDGSEITDPNFRSSGVSGGDGDIVHIATGSDIDSYIQDGKVIYDHIRPDAQQGFIGFPQGDPTNAAVRLTFGSGNRTTPTWDGPSVSFDVDDSDLFDLDGASNVVTGVTYFNGPVEFNNTNTVFNGGLAITDDLNIGGQLKIGVTNLVNEILRSTVDMISLSASSATNYTVNLAGPKHQYIAAGSDDIFLNFSNMPTTGQSAPIRLTVLAGSSSRAFWHRQGVFGTTNIYSFPAFTNSVTLAAGTMLEVEIRGMQINGVTTNIAIAAAQYYQ